MICELLKLIITWGLILEFECLKVLKIPEGVMTSSTKNSN